jgi:hypothetical protein
MICQKCGVGHMVDDSRHGITVFKCWVCGDRTYPEHPKRSGAFVCSRCGDDMEEKNELGLCKNCLRVLNIHAVRLKERNYGEFVCACGTTFMRKSPSQLFHSKECRKRVMTVSAEQGPYHARNPRQRRSAERLVLTP